MNQNLVKAKFKKIMLKLQLLDEKFLQADCIKQYWDKMLSLMQSHFKVRNQTCFSTSLKFLKKILYFLDHNS